MCFTFECWIWSTIRNFFFFFFSCKIFKKIQKKDGGHRWKLSLYRHAYTSFISLSRCEKHTGYTECATLDQAPWDVWHFLDVHQDSVKDSFAYIENTPRKHVTYFSFFSLLIFHFFPRWGVNFSTHAHITFSILSIASVTSTNLRCLRFILNQKREIISVSHSR